MPPKITENHGKVLSPETLDRGTCFQIWQGTAMRQVGLAADTMYGAGHTISEVPEHRYTCSFSRQMFILLDLFFFGCVFWFYCAVKNNVITWFWFASTR